MGMFDYVVCEVPLPDGWEPSELQSKDFDCEMTTIRVSGEGRLLIERYETYTVPKEDRRYPDAPDGSIMSFCGILGKRNRHWVDLNFHGDFNFYGTERVGKQTFVQLTEGSNVGYYEGERRWHEYVARFTDGNLVSIRAVHDPEPLPATPPSQSTDR